MKFFVSTVLVCIALNLKAQTKNYFPGLTRVSIDTIMKAFISYDNSFRFKLQNCSTLPKRHPFYLSEEYEYENYLVGAYKNPKLTDSIYFVYDPGMSDDPTFLVYTKSKKIIGSISALELYVLGNGSLYSSGHINSMYNRKRRFQIQKDTLTEIKQPYYYVGIKGKTTRDVVLYKEKTGPAIVAKLVKGNEIEVLLAESSIHEYDIDDYFLVRTDFGLVGWVRLEDEKSYEALVEGLFFYGD